MSLMDLFLSHVLVVFAVWAGALSCWKITSDCCALENNCEKQTFLQYYPVFQSINWLFTVKQLTNTSSWKGSPHHDTSSSMLNCGTDAFTIVFLTICRLLFLYLRTVHFSRWSSPARWGFGPSRSFLSLNIACCFKALTYSLNSW